MLKLALGAAGLLLAAGSTLAAEMATGNASDLKWGPAPPTLQKGAQLAVLAGNPRGETGLYVVRLKLPANYKIAPHSHPKAEFVTVISGSFHVGMGEKYDEKSAHELTAGGFTEAAANMNHYAWTPTETVVQIQGEAPLGIKYVNPADDPSKKSQ